MAEILIQLIWVLVYIFAPLALFRLVGAIKETKKP